jgi:FkbM family methyltransferase
VQALRTARRLVHDQRLLRHSARLYRQFVAPGDLAFDIGAHTGERTKALLRIGARVVAVEPQPEYAGRIDKGAAVELCAVGSSPGEAPLRLAPGAPELATLSDQWIESIGTRFPEFSHTEKISVPVTTLDALIDKYGEPAFCKIDTEGYDAEVIEGLSSPIRALCFELAMEALEVPFRSMGLLSQLADYQFAFSLGQSMTLSPWTSRIDAETSIRQLGAMSWGDVYALAKGV